jgi:hypothetical protein
MVQGSASSADHPVPPAYELGIVTNQVVVLSKENFHIALSDPANSFWFLKFFAPWYVWMTEK